MFYSKSNCDKAYFLYRYALELLHRFSLEINSALKKKYKGIKCAINDNFGELIS